MLGLARTSSRLLARPLARSFAEIVPTASANSNAGDSAALALSNPSPSSPAPLHVGLTEAARKNRIPVREDHGLYAFFRKKDGEDLVGDARYETVESPEGLQKRASGRGWKASELRLKSFRDLHTLWYVVLRERNLLATQKEETRRLGVTSPELQVNSNKVHECRKTMARIKAVINERRLAFEGAVKIAEQQKNAHHDEVVLQHQIAEFKKERKYLTKRRLFNERRRALRRSTEEGEARIRLLLAEASQAEANAEVNSVGEEVNAVDVGAAKPARQDSLPEDVEAAAPSTEKATTTQSDASSLPKEPKLKAAKEQVKKEQKPQEILPENPADTAAAGLFGQAEVVTRARR